MKVCNKLGQTEEAQRHLAQFEALKARQLAGEATREELQDEKFIPPRIAEIQTLVAKAYLDGGDIDAAERHIRQAAATYEKETESRQMLVQLMSRKKQWREALVSVKELRQIEPANSVHYWNEGILYQRANMFDDAERVFRDFCKSQPAQDGGYASLAALYFQENRKLNEARSLAERAVDLNPSAHNYWLLGSIAKKQGDVTTARAAFKRAAEIDPENLELAKMYESIGIN